MHAMNPRPVLLPILAALVALATFSAPKAQDAAAPATVPLSILVGGVDSLAAYAAVTTQLESLGSIRSLEVLELSSGTVTYRVALAGSTAELTQALAAGGHLRPVDAALSGGSELRYQYQP